MVQVTLKLPDNFMKQVQSFGQATKRNAETVLTETLEMMWPAWAMLFSQEEDAPIATCSDEDVLTFADSKMDPVQNERLGELQAHGKECGLTTSEQFELLVLMHLYQIGQLRKSEGLAEAVRRGLREPLAS